MEQFSGRLLQNTERHQFREQSIMAHMCHDGRLIGVSDEQQIKLDPGRADGSQHWNTAVRATSGCSCDRAGDKRTGLPVRDAIVVYNSGVQ